MDFFSNLALGFGVALTPANLLVALLGCALGTLIGVLPRMGPVATIAMMLPATYAMQPVSALILLAGIYYGAQYGRSTAATLVSQPDEPASVVTPVDGHQMARQGRAGLALALAGVSSFFAGCVGTLILAAFAPMLIQLAFRFGPAEYFSLMVLALVGAAVMASGSLIKALGMAAHGLLLGLVGTDFNVGGARFALDMPELRNGLGFAVVAMGVFGYGEIISNLAQPERARAVVNAKAQRVWPSRQDLKDMTPAVMRGTAMGSLLGLLPGGGALLAAIAAYALETRIKSKPGEVPLGSGNMRGVVAPESADSAAAQTSFIPMLTLGISLNVVMALMVGAMTIHNIQPGPQVMASNPEFFWGLIASMLIGNLMLVVLNVPLIRVWIRLLNVPYRWLFPVIVLLCAVGAYTIHRSTFDVWLVAAFGFVGYLFDKLDMQPAPMLLGFVLGPMMEEDLRQALLTSGGDWSVFVMRPMSAGMLLAAVCMLFLVLMPVVKSRRAEAFVKE